MNMTMPALEEAIANDATYQAQISSKSKPHTNAETRKHLFCSLHCAAISLAHEPQATQNLPPWSRPTARPCAPLGSTTSSSRPRPMPFLRAPHDGRGRGGGCYRPHKMRLGCIACPESQPEPALLGLEARATPGKRCSPSEKNKNSHKKSSTRQTLRGSSSQIAVDKT